MSVLFDALEKTLRSQKDIGEQLIRTSNELKSAVLIGDISMINIWMGKTQVLIKQQKVMNEDREAVVSRLCSSLGCAYNVTLCELVTHVDKEQADRLMLLMEDIKETMDAQQRINESIYKISRARLGVMDNINHIIYRAAGLSGSMAVMNEAVYRKEI